MLKYKQNYSNIENNKLIFIKNILGTFQNTLFFIKIFATFALVETYYTKYCYCLLFLK